MRGLLRRLRWLERHTGARRWCVVRVGHGWRGDVRAALGLDLGEGDVLVRVADFAEPDTPPRLVSISAVT